MLFREVNERIRELNHAFSVLNGSYDVLCECGHAACVERVDVPVPTYEELRDAGRRFVVTPGHEQETLDELVADHGTYRVVATRDWASTLVLGAA